MQFSVIFAFYRIQLAGVEKAYLALDNIEVRFRNEIPLWLFGLTY